MKCVAVCQTALAARNLHRALGSSLELNVLITDRTMSRRLHDVGIPTSVADSRRVDSYLKMHVGTWMSRPNVILDDSPVSPGFPSRTRLARSGAGRGAPASPERGF